jgi:predicted nuclease of predicted toxin-antitoxin system
MIFLIDQQLPPALTGWLQSRGHEATHVRNIGLRDADDVTIWRHAEAMGAIVVTKDMDFVTMRSRALTGPTIVWLRIGNVTTPDLAVWLEMNWVDIEAALHAGDAVVEVR